MNAYFDCELPVQTGLASRDFVAREFLPKASLIPPRELCSFFDSVGEQLLSDSHEPDASAAPEHD